MVYDKVTNEEHWMILRMLEKDKELIYPVTTGHEYYVQIHVAEVSYTRRGVRIEHKICQPILHTSFMAGKCS